MEKVKLSVVILTKNEEDQIADCIKSVVDWVDEVVVVDDESSDKTVEIAKSLSARVLVKKMDIEGKHRNWAYQQAKNEWILSLDADERVTEELKEEIVTVLSKNIFDALAIPRKNFIGNYWIKGGGFFPSPQLKLFRKDKFRWEEVEVHPRAFLEGKCGSLVNALLHYTYKDWEEYLRKLNRQTTLEAWKWYKLSQVNPKKAGYKMNLLHTLWRVVDRFIRTFIIKKGYKDGFIGFMIAYFSSFYQLVSYAKYREFSKKQK